MTQQEKIERRERRTKRSEIFKNWFEVFAIAIGGCWVFYNFILKDAPNLDKSFNISSVVKAFSFSHENGKNNPTLITYCDLNYRLELKNVSYNNLYIDSIKIRVWQIPIEFVASKKYMDFNSIASQNEFPPVAEITFTKGSMMGFYPPETENAEDFDFQVSIDYNKAVMVAHNIMGHGKTKWFKSDEKFDKFGFSWLPQCIPSD